MVYPHQLFPRRETPAQLINVNKFIRPYHYYSFGLHKEAVIYLFGGGRIFPACRRSVQRKFPHG